MSTNFDLSITSQSMMFFKDLDIKASEQLITFSHQHTNIARFTGFSIALCFSLLDLAQAVSNIVEPLIKGIANVFGSPFSEKCKLSRGLKQIFLQFPIHLFNGVIGWPLGTALDVLVTPFKMLISPVSALESRKENAEQMKQILDAIFNDKAISLSPDPRVALVLKVQIFIIKHSYT